MLLQAANAIIAALSLDDDAPIGAGELRFESMHVRLTLYPDPPMTWKMFGSTVQGLTNFVNLFEFVGFDFVVHETNRGLLMEIGCGLLAFTSID